MNRSDGEIKKKQRRKGVEFDDLFPVPVSVAEGAQRREELVQAIDTIESDAKKHGADRKEWFDRANKALWIKRQHLALLDRWLIDQGGILANLYEQVQTWATRVTPDTPVPSLLKISFQGIAIHLYDPTEEHPADMIVMSWKEFQETVCAKPIFK